MKKVMIAVAVLGLAAVAAQAQSPRCEVLIMDAAFGGSMSDAAMGKNYKPAKKAAAKKPAKADAKSAPKMEQWFVAFDEALERAYAEQLQKDSEKRLNAEKAVAQNQQQPQAQVPAKNVQPVKNEDNEDAGGSVLKAMFGGPYPGETKGSYKTRQAALSYPAFGNKL